MYFKYFSQLLRSNYSFSFPPSDRALFLREYCQNTQIHTFLPRSDSLNIIHNYISALHTRSHFRNLAVVFIIFAVIMALVLVSLIICICCRTSDSNQYYMFSQQPSVEMGNNISRNIQRPINKPTVSF